jgi:hypothetical protein
MVQNNVLLIREEISVTDIMIHLQVRSPNCSVVLPKLLY